MKGILNYLEGLKEAAWELRYSLYIWLLSLGFTLSLYIPVTKFFTRRVGHFADWAYLKEHPTYISLLYSNSGILFSFMLSLFMIFYIASLIVEGGIWAGILRREPFSYWRRYFSRFLVLEILTPIVYLPFLVIAGVLALLLKPIPYYHEKVFSWAVIIYLLILIFLVFLASVTKDYAKISVVRDNSSCLKAIFYAWKVGFGRWFSSAIMGILAFVLWAIPFFLFKDLFSSLPSFLFFLILQIPLLLKAYTRVSLFYGEKYLSRDFS